MAHSADRGEPGMGDILGFVTMLFTCNFTASGIITLSTGARLERNYRLVFIQFAYSQAITGAAAILLMLWHLTLRAAAVQAGISSSL
jgi:hypothetical protein